MNAGQRGAGLLVASRVAFYVCLNIEHMPHRQPIDEHLGGHASLVLDPLNYGWRGYGPRVAIWRLIESLDRHGIRASALAITRRARSATRRPSKPARLEGGRGSPTGEPTPGLQTCMTARRSASA